MLFSEENVRANIRNREGQRVFYLGKGDRLTPGARDYLTRERIPILPGEAAKPERYRLLSGGYTEEKPEHMTHLNAQVLVCKTHPRIRFRGKLDSLEAELILCQLQEPSLAKELGEILSLAREILRCEVLEKPLEMGALCGLTEEAQRRRSHTPQEFYGVPHFMPSSSDGLTIARLNRLRTLTRETELAAVEAFLTRDGELTRTDVVKALNRMSSMLYILMIQQKGKNL